MSGTPRRLSVFASGHQPSEAGYVVEYLGRLVMRRDVFGFRAVWCSDLD